jgi:hypothetical protein
VLLGKGLHVAYESGEVAGIVRTNGLYTSMREMRSKNARLLLPRFSGSVAPRLPRNFAQQRQSAASDHGHPQTA